MTSIYGILDTETNEFVSYNSKCAWSKVGNAKNAFNLHTGATHSWYNPPRPKFDEQTRYVIVDLTEAYFRLEGLMK
jgi:hypothetical protein